MDRFSGYECSVLSGAVTIGKAVDRLERLTRCREIESKISELRGQLKKAAFNRQVELNTQIKKFEQELKQLADKL
jgi:septal ring factor EnvC (AmiA/AmiB activator)